MAAVLKKNGDNARCVSWILKDITDPEALDAAILLAGTIRWFEDKIDVKPLYDLIIFTFDTCFDSNGMLHQGLRNRAYYSGRAILWIHTLAICKSKDIVHMFPFPTRNNLESTADEDLRQLLLVFHSSDLHSLARPLLEFCGELTRPHSQWTSNVLLHLSWAAQTRGIFFRYSFTASLLGVNPSTPLDVSFNFLLMCSNLLGSSVEEEALKVQDKSYGISCSCSPSTHTSIY